MWLGKLEFWTEKTVLSYRLPPSVNLAVVLETHRLPRDFRPIVCPNGSLRRTGLLVWPTDGVRE